MKRNENKEDPMDAVRTHETRLVGLAEAGRFLGVTVRSVQNLILRGTLHPCDYPGLRRTLLDREDLERLVKAGRAK